MQKVALKHQKSNPVQSVPITTYVVSLNPTNGEVYSIQHYVIKISSDLPSIAGFFRVFQVYQYNWPPWYNWNIVESGVKHHNPIASTSYYIYMYKGHSKEPGNVTFFNSCLICTGSNYTHYPLIGRMRLSCPLWTVICYGDVSFKIDLTV